VTLIHDDLGPRAICKVKTFNRQQGCKCNQCNLIKFKFSNLISNSNIKIKYQMLKFTLFIFTFFNLQRALHE
jgi:hypothetical protein